jgi:hypothetical protein
MTVQSNNRWNQPGGAKSTGRYMVVAMLVAMAFFASYAYAAQRGATVAEASVGTARGQYAYSGAGAGAGGGCAMSGGGGTTASTGGGCCGAGGGGKVVKGAAKIEGGVQRISIDTSRGSYDPNEIALKAGVPAEITFSASSGCLRTVIFPDAGIQADLSQGATIKLPAMKAGEYQFSCGMRMVFGKLVVK